MLFVFNGGDGPDRLPLLGDGVVWVIFGCFPAFKAALLDPIVSLRRE